MKSISPVSKFTINLIGTFLVFFLTGVAHSTPTVSTVTGSIQQGSTLSIAGSSFGTGNPSVLLWDNFETGTNGSALPANPQLGSWFLNNGGPKYTNSAPHAGSLSATAASSTGNALFANIEYEPLSHASGVKYYQSYWFKYNSPVGGSGQTKLTQLWGSYRVGDYNPGVMTGGLAGDWWKSYIALENSGSVLGVDYRTTPSRNQWHLFEMLLQQSDANVANGRITIRVDGANVYNQNPTKTRELANQGWDFTTFFDGMTNWGAPVQTWVDNVYFNDSWARVEIGDQPTYSASTQREIQLPISWTDGGVTINFNQGSFNSGNTVYLYVVDSNDAVNAQGYPLTIGGGGGGLPTAPINLQVR